MMRKTVMTYLILFLASIVFLEAWASGEELQLTNNSYSDISPQIHNGQVVWQGYNGHDDEIFYWDGASVQQLTNNSYDDKYPQIYEGRVVWQAYYGGADYEILYWDGTSVQQNIGRLKNV